MTPDSSFGPAPPGQLDAPAFAAARAPAHPRHAPHFSDRL